MTKSILGTSAALLAHQSPAPTISKIEEFLLEAALYKRLPAARNVAQVFRMLNEHSLKADGFCPFCHDTTTYARTGNTYASQNGFISTLEEFQKKEIFDRITFRCARDESHLIWIWVYVSGSGDFIQKVGQHPSVADVANDQSKQFSKVLKQQDAKELHRAIGLAAQGVGIGSFVYLRRVFERLIKSRFTEHMAEEKWSESDWAGKRMDERIKLMKDHLPEFLVENSSVYGILSKGIHELDEDTCLGMFVIVKESIVEILEEDERKRQKAEHQKKLTKALQEIKGKQS